MCHLYDKCLDIAILKDWENFSCLNCGLYMQTKSLSDKWLEENAFRCKLGRVTPAQCKMNREKPDVLEKHTGLKNSLDQREWYKRNRVYMPSVCAGCKDWEILCISLSDEHTKEKERSMAKENQQTETATAVPKSICACGKQFEPYQRGATVVKKLCRECLNRKTGIQQQKQKSDAASSMPVPISRSHDTIQLVFSQSDHELLKRIRELSLLERRSVESQILYWLERNVPELKADSRTEGT